MASAFHSAFDQPVLVRRRDASAQPWQAISVEVGGTSVALSREEAAQLIVDLRSAVEATPADVGETA